MKKRVEVFSDGSCLGNPGPGGWAALIRTGDEERWVAGSDIETTNNRMELQAAIEGLRAISDASKIVLTTDSRYVVQGITKWIKNWKALNWSRGKSGPVKNKDLWIELDRETQRHEEIDWIWVRGHSGHPENDQVDKIARLEAANAHKNDEMGSMKTNQKQWKFEIT